MLEVRFFHSTSGDCPIEEFLDSLSAKQAQKVVWVLRLIEEVDSVPAEYLKKLSGTADQWEVRVRHAGNIFRLLGFLNDQGRLVLTHGFQKKTNRIPRREITLAEKRKREYMKRRR